MGGGRVGMTADAYHLTDPDPNGKSLGKAVKDSFEMAGIIWKRLIISIHMAPPLC